METLELGYELVRRRGRLTALACLLSPNHDHAGLAVRKALTAAWRGREAIKSVDDLDSHLNRLLRVQLEARRR